MNTGDVSEPFLDGTYPCIIKVTRKEDATVIPLAEVRNRITDYYKLTDKHRNRTDSKPSGIYRN